MMRRLAVVAALSAGSLVLAACGSDDATPAADTASGTADAAFNNADVTFAQGMIPHHSQAIDMAALAADRSRNPAVLDLATRIEAAQDPEIAQMRGWLQTWGHDEMPADMEDMEDMDHGMSGMMSDDDLDALEAATGAEFDQLFAQMMIEHHQGAIEMAQTVLDDGADPEVRQLAEAIITAQSDEITEMQNLDLR